MLRKLLLLATAISCPSLWAAPTITATKVDDLTAGTRKLPGDNVTYTITIGNAAGAADPATNVVFHDADPLNTTFVSLNSTPVARNDTYSAIGNVQISIAAPGLLANDNDPDGIGAAPTVTAVNTAGTHGNVTFNANGSFTFNPEPGYEGATTFTYTLTDNEGSTDTGTVTVNVSGMIWFINASAAAGGADGRLTNPFNSVASYTASSPTKDAGDNIFLYTGSYTGLTLGTNQRLIGQGALTTLQAITGLTPPTGSLAFPATGGTRPTISVSSGTGVTLGSGNTVNGLNVTNSNGSGITGSAVGTLTLADFDVTVTGGTALSLTTSGTVTATGADNDLNSTNNTTLNVTNVTIGATGLAFKSISSGGSATAGIVLDNTAALGSLTVAGSGTAGSGGTIANKTGGNILSGANATGQSTSGTGGTGIFLRSTLSPSFTRMQINDCSNFGIYGLNVTGFTLANSVVNGTNGNNNAGNQEEASIRFDNLLGSGSISNSTVSGGATGNLLVYNTSGTLNRLTLTGNTFGLISASTGNDNVDLTVYNTATGNITLTSNIFQGTRGDFFEAISNNNSFMDVIARSNTFQNGQTIIPGGGTGISVRGGSGGNNSTATTTFDISNNLINGAQANAFDTVGIFVAKGQDLGTMVGTIQGNTVGPAKAGSNSDGIFLRAAGSGTTTVLFRNNTITGFGSAAIHLQANDGSSTMNASFFGNVVSAPLGFAFSGLFLDNGATAGPPADTNQMNVVIGSSVAGETAKKNDFSAGDPGNFSDLSINNNFAATTMRLSRNGSASGTAAQIIKDDNLNPATTTISPAGTITLVNTLPALPPVVAPLLLADGGVEAKGDMAEKDRESARSIVSPEKTDAARVVLESPAKVGTTAGDVKALTQSELDALVTTALARWTTVGLSKEQLATLRQLTFEVADLPGLYLGEAGGQTIRVDNNAGGNGWFIDQTPLEETEFSNILSETRLTTTPEGAPAGRVDLLTTILHEMGHAIGLCDSYAETDRDRLMYGFLTKGERRLPSRRDALAARIGGGVPHLHPHFLLTDLTIGDLPPGKTVTITYVVKIDTPTSVISTSNQGTVSGGNFTTFSTDDTRVAGAANATVTPIHQPPVVSDVAVSTAEDTTLAFTAANFNGGSTFTDPNGDTLAKVKITSLPSAASGTLKVGGVDATVNQEVAIGSIGTLTFVPALNYNGAASFGWNGADNSAQSQYAVTSKTVNITVTAVNDAPVLDASKTPVMTVEIEDAPLPVGAVGTPVANLVDLAPPAGGLDNVTDPDSATIGIAITAADASNGVWWYSIDSGTNWLTLGSVSSGSARLLTATPTSRLYFQPNANFNGTVATAITFCAWDTSTGTNGATASSTPAGGSTAFSTATDTASLTITAVNDAPVLDASKTPVLTAENEDAPVPVGSVGTSVTNLVDLTPPAGGLDNVTDPDSATIGIAVTGADATNGVWWYSIDSGTNWLALGSVSSGSARLLTAVPASRLYFQPNANFNGVIAAAITFCAWDTTSGTNGATASSTPAGGTTAFSTATDTASLTITSVNDNPVAGADTIERYPTQTVKVPKATLLANDTDPDGGTPAFVSVSAASANGGTVTSDATMVYYTPAVGFTTADSFTYTINDGQGGTAVGTVTVAIKVDNAQSANATKIESVAGGGMKITFAGIPGRSYRVQSSDTLATGPWTDRLTIAADAQGKFEFTDPGPGLPPTRYYRSVQP